MIKKITPDGATFLLGLLGGSEGARTLDLHSDSVAL